MRAVRDARNNVVAEGTPVDLGSDGGANVNGSPTARGAISGVEGFTSVQGKDALTGESTVEAMKESAGDN